MYKSFSLSLSWWIRLVLAVNPFGLLKDVSNLIEVSEDYYFFCWKFGLSWILLCCITLRTKLEIIALRIIWEILTSILILERFVWLDQKHWNVYWSFGVDFGGCMFRATTTWAFLGLRISVIGENIILSNFFFGFQG